MVKWIKPWVGHWWWYSSDGCVAVVKQDGELLSPSCFDGEKAETCWIFLGKAQIQVEVTFHEKGNSFEAKEKVPIEFIPFPPVEYMEEGAHEFELTENSYILYD